jgi:hypothetical protein
VCLGTFAQVLKEIAEDKEVEGTKTCSGGDGKARCILAAGGFPHKTMMTPSWY